MKEELSSQLFTKPPRYCTFEFKTFLRVFFFQLSLLLSSFARVITFFFQLSFLFSFFFGGSFRLLMIQIRVDGAQALTKLFLTDFFFSFNTSASFEGDSAYPSGYPGLVAQSKFLGIRTRVSCSQISILVLNCWTLF